MTPTPTSIKFAGSNHNKPGMAGADHLTPGAPATFLCPKCGTSMRSYTRGNGQRMLQCRDRKGCNLRLPIADAPAPDHGLGDVKALPGAQLDGLAGLRAV